MTSIPGMVALSWFAPPHGAYGRQLNGQRAQHNRYMIHFNPSDIQEMAVALGCDLRTQQVAVGFTHVSHVHEFAGFLVTGVDCAVSPTRVEV